MARVHAWLYYISVSDSCREILFHTFRQAACMRLLLWLSWNDVVIQLLWTTSLYQRGPMASPWWRQGLNLLHTKRDRLLLPKEGANPAAGVHTADRSPKNTQTISPCSCPAASAAPMCSPGHCCRDAGSRTEGFPRFSTLCCPRQALILPFPQVSRISQLKP